jgi:hypothetical protein
MADPYREGAPGDRILPKWWKWADALLKTGPFVVGFAPSVIAATGLARTNGGGFDSSVEKILVTASIAGGSLPMTVMLWGGSGWLRKRWAERLMRVQTEPERLAQREPKPSRWRWVFRFVAVAPCWAVVFLMFQWTRIVGWPYFGTPLLAAISWALLGAAPPEKTPLWFRLGLWSALVPRIHRVDG